MRTLFRAKSFVWIAYLAVWCGAALSVDSLRAAPFHGSLYTSLKEGQAIGPLPEDPVPYYPYQPKEIARLEELPDGIRTRVVTHLQERVGEDFYRQLNFGGGQVVDLDELHRVNPDSRRFKREVPAYILRFEFEMPKVGIRHYTATLTLKRDGSVLQEVDLPATAANPAKLRFKPLREVGADLVRRRLLDPEAATATVTYDRFGDRLAWHFEQVLPGRGPEVKVRRIDADANTGEIIHKS